MDGWLGSACIHKREGDHRERTWMVTLALALWVVREKFLLSFCLNFPLYNMKTILCQACLTRVLGDVSEECMNYKTHTDVRPEHGDWLSEKVGTSMLWQVLLGTQTIPSNLWETAMRLWFSSYHPALEKHENQRGGKHIIIIKWPLGILYPGCRGKVFLATPASGLLS